MDDAAAAVVAEEGSADRTGTATTEDMAAAAGKEVAPVSCAILQQVVVTATTVPVAALVESEPQTSLTNRIFRASTRPSPLSRSDGDTGRRRRLACAPVARPEIYFS